MLGSWLMKKLIGIVFIAICWGNIVLADINLSCVITGWNTNDSYHKDIQKIEYEEVKPSGFSVIIEITSPGEVIGRFIETSESGYMLSPFVGTIDDSQILMNKKITKLDERGNDFKLNLITGMFSIDKYIHNYKYWFLQNTGTCKIAN